MPWVCLTTFSCACIRELRPISLDVQPLLAEMSATDDQLFIAFNNAAFLNVLILNVEFMRDGKYDGASSVRSEIIDQSKSDVTFCVLQSNACLALRREMCAAWVDACGGCFE